MIRQRIIVVAVIFVVLGAIVASAYLAKESSRTQTSTSDSVSATSPNGLRLTLSLPASSIFAGQKLNVSIGLFNALSTPLDVLAGNPRGVPQAPNWTLEGFPLEIWPACYSTMPIVFAVMSGNYTIGQIRAMNGNWTTGGEQATGCTAAGLVYNAVFEPHSDRANLNGTWISGSIAPDQSLGSYSLESNFTIGGYWSYPLTVSSSTQDMLTPVNGSYAYFYPETTGPGGYSPFTSGVYTLAVDDEWGQIVEMHFTVNG